jgi:thiosulfate dehydrogenase [quinone] large subunit
MEENRTGYIWAALRIAMGWLFLWAFLDKLFGLGFATQADGAWIRGGSPTLGFLQFGTAGPFAGLFQSIAGNPVVDWLFMLGLLLIGLALMSGIAVRIAAYSAVVFVLLIWLSHLPPANNPLIDEHIVYAILLVGLARAKAGEWLGLGKRWSAAVAKSVPVLVPILG